MGLNFEDLHADFTIHGQAHTAPGSTLKEDGKEVYHGLDLECATL